MRETKRFEILDAFRFLAILMVILFHYYTRWTQPYHSTNLYPYEDHYSYFHWGRMGVHFFFMISGFVIFLTLDNSETISQFVKKRMIRLLPSMVLVSTLTFMFISLFDNTNLFSDSQSLKNLFFSWTFLPKNIGGSDLRHIDGSYWTLWIEIQFYAIAAIIYFLLKSVNRSHLLIYILFVISIICQQLSINYPNWLFWQYINLFTCSNFFLLGMLFKSLYQSKPTRSYQTIFNHSLILLLFINELLIYSDNRISKIITTIFISAFYLITYIPLKETKFSNHSVYRTILLLGQASYISYLFHQNIGVLVINKINYKGPFDFMIPAFTIVFIFMVSIWLYKSFEVKISRYLKMQLS